MTCTNLNLRLWGLTLIGLLSINQTYALESAMTPGPSVGHRPVINGLVLGTARGDISQNTVPLYVGEVISRTGGTITDVDGDPVEAGEYCVWSRVDPNTLKEAVMAVGRPCSYTLQPGDVGFKIKNEIRAISDPAAAAAKGLRLNPDESWPVRTLSANTVIAATPVPFSGSGFGVDLITHLNRFYYGLDSGFPSAGFTGATFTIETGNNSQYDWSSNQPSWINVNASGIVTFVAKPIAATKKFRVLATSKTDKSLVYYHDFTVNTWWYNNGNTNLNWEWSKKTCETNGVYPYVSDMVGKRGAIARYPNNLYANWGDITKYTGSGFGAYSWTKDPLIGGTSRILARLNKGVAEISRNVNNSYPVTCFQYL